MLIKLVSHKYACKLRIPKNHNFQITLKSLHITLPLAYLVVLCFHSVLEPAQITGYSNDPMILLSGTAEIWCKFKGTPSPRVQWYFKGGLVPDQHIITTVPSNKTVHGMTTLTINNVQFQDIGSYRCVVSNYLQSVHQEFNLCGESEYYKFPHFHRCTCMNLGVWCCLDDIPDVVSNVRAKTISQTQVKVYWKPPANVNSDPSLLRYRVSYAYIHADTHTQHTHSYVHFYPLNTH